MISVKVRTDNVDDRKPVLEIVNKLLGWFYGDKSYMSGPLERKLIDKGVTLITSMKKT
nr:transposase [Candidatus Enterovibrio escacola]